MIDKEGLISIANLRRFNPRNAEKEYFQDLVLHSLYSLAGKKLVFKGGTCLYKIHKLNRFSEDLDFDAEKGIKLDIIVQKTLYNMRLLGINCAIKYIDKSEKGINIGINFNGPLYNGTKQSLCFLLLNISTRRKTVLPPNFAKIASIYNEFPDFDVFSMDPKEILAEKVAAIHERNKPRDVYDLWFLLNHMKIKLDEKLVKTKLKKNFNKEVFTKKLLEKEKYWEDELERFIIGQLPSFQKISKEITESI